MKALPNKACAARNPAPRRSGAAGPPDRRSCKASASRTNDPERDAASEGADVGGRSGDEFGRRPLLGLAAFLGAGGVGVLGAEATPTVEEMLERTKENRLKNDAARYASGEAKFLAAQGRADTRTPEQLEDLMQRLAKGKEEPEVLSPEPEPAAPEPEPATPEPEPAAPDPESAGAEGPLDEIPRTPEEVPATQTPVEPAAESPGEAYEETWAGRPAW